VETNVHAATFDGVPIQPDSVRVVGDRSGEFLIEVDAIP
jgi:hypothetical protein